MTIDIQLINQLMNPRKRRILALAELAMPAEKFDRFKREFLRELGDSGFIRELEKYSSNKER